MPSLQPMPLHDIDDDTLGNWDGDWDDWDPDGPVDTTGTEAHATDGPGMQEREATDCE
jgi:hypothetical protein